MEPIDLTAITGIVMGMLVVLIPVAGLTLRFAIKPITEALSTFRQSGMERDKVDLLERRMALLEQEMHGMESLRDDLSRTLEAAEFQRQLKTPQEPGR